SCLRKTTTDLRIGTTEHRSGGVVQKSPFARFLASFDFRLFRQHRPTTEIAAANCCLQLTPHVLAARELFNQLHCTTTWPTRSFSSDENLRIRGSPALRARQTPWDQSTG